MRTLENCERRPGAKNYFCSICGEPITRKPNQAWRDVAVVVDEKRVSRFRGDDIVKFYHPECIRLEELDDNHFTWWYDAQDWEGMSVYEIAQTAWNEAVRRMLNIERKEQKCKK